MPLNRHLTQKKPQRYFNFGNMEITTDIQKTGRISVDDLLFISLEMGEHILRCGGEISRAEDTIRRICKAYGASHVDVTAIWSMIALTVDLDGKRSTCTRRITDSVSTNLDKLSRLNNLSRSICAKLPSADEVISEMKNIDKSSHIPIFKFIIGSFLSSLGFTVFFADFSNGISPEIILAALIDAIFAGIFAVPLCLISFYLSNTRTNPILSKFLVCLIGGVSAMLAGRFITICHPDKIMIGNIMNFIPGVALTNSFRDLFGGDTMSGLFRLCTVLIDAIAIAAGYAVAILIFGGAV